MWKVQVVRAWETALLYVDGRFDRVLPAGRHRIWALGRDIEIQRMFSRDIILTTAMIEVVTQDRFALRMSGAVVGKIVDPRAAIESQGQYVTRFHLLGADVLVALAAERSLDGLLADRAALGPTFLERLGDRFPEVKLETGILNGLVLPPETRRMLTESERVRREGEAALERARGEHAALRSLANAARLLKDNPELMKLRTLQAVSPTGKGATLVLGQDALGAPRP